MVYRAPQCWAWTLSLCFCFLYLVEHLIWFFFFAKIFFGSFGFFFIPPSFVLTPLMIENFLLCPLVLFGHFQSLRFFLCLSHLPPIWGAILGKVISKKCYWGLSYPFESSTSRWSFPERGIDFGVFVLWKRESPPSIMITRKPNWSFRDSKARDWLRKGKVLTPLVRPT